MKNKLLILVILALFNFNSISLAAGSSSGSNDDTKKMSDFDWGEMKIKKAKKYEKKGKTKKADKNYKEAIKYFFKANEKDTTNPDVYNYLGFAHRKIGNFKDAEMYYLIGLELDPKHNGINEYLGELYVATNRMDLAQKRLAVLMNCSCKEFDELKAVIEGKKESKY